jgi:DNA topoisomerase IA
LNFSLKAEQVVVMLDHITPDTAEAQTLCTKRWQPLPKCVVSAGATAGTDSLSGSDPVQCSELYLATDEDREGEAISWHLMELLQPKVRDETQQNRSCCLTEVVVVVVVVIVKVPVRRAVFHEITKGGVATGLGNPRAIDQNLVEAQHARRVLDRVAGYTMSPLLWKKITVSAGSDPLCSGSSSGLSASLSSLS